MPLLGIYPKKPKTLIQKDTCTPMFITALFTIAKIWKQPKCPSTDEWIKRMCYTYPMEHYSAIRKNRILPFAATWMDLRTRGGGRISWDKVTEWHGHIYTTKCKIDS